MTGTFAQKFREHLQRLGFYLCKEGPEEWKGGMAAPSQTFRPVGDLDFSLAILTFEPPEEINYQ